MQNDITRLVTRDLYTTNVPSQGHQKFRYALQRRRFYDPWFLEDTYDLLSLRSLASLVVEASLLSVTPRVTFAIESCCPDRQRYTHSYQATTTRDPAKTT